MPCGHPSLLLKSDNELALYLLDLTCARGDTQQQLEQLPVAQSSQFVNDGMLEDSGLNIVRTSN